MPTHGIVISPPTRRPLADYWRDARAVCATVEPPCSFREALSVYRQMRFGFRMIFRCRFENNNN